MQPVEASSVLVVDDDALLAMELEMVLGEAGYRVLGPTATVRDSLVIIDGETIDAAVLDVTLQGERSDAIADRLAEDGVPFLFLSGHTVDILPKRHAERPLVSKPFREGRLLETLQALLG